MRHERLNFLGHAHALFDRALHTNQTDAVLVLHQLTDRANAAVAEVIDVVDDAATVTQLDQVANALEDVALGEDLGFDRLVDLELVVQLEATDLREVVTLAVEEQVVEQLLRGFDGGRIARAQAAIDFHHGFFRALQLVGEKRVAQVRTHVEVVDEEDFHLFDAAIAQVVELGFGQLFIALQQHFASVVVDDVASRDLAFELVDFDRQAIDARLLQLADRTLGELTVLLDQDFFGLGVLDVARGALADEQLVVHFAAVLLARLEVDDFGVVEVVQQLFGRVAERAQQHRRVELTTAIDADVEDVLVIELEVEPRAAVRNDAGAVQQLARGVGLALVVIEEHTRRAVELRNDDALGAVHDERTALGHERNFTEVNFLFLDVANRGDAGLLVDVPHREANHHLDRRSERHATRAAFIDVVLGLLEVVGNEIQRAGLREVLDREDALEDALDADRLALLVRDIDLQKLIVRPLLDVDQVRDIDDLLELGETFTDAEVILDCRCHRRTSLFESRGLFGVVENRGKKTEDESKKRCVNQQARSATSIDHFHRDRSKTHNDGKAAERNSPSLQLVSCESGNKFGTSGVAYNMPSEKKCNLVDASHRANFGPIRGRSSPNRPLTGPPT